MTRQYPTVPLDETTPYVVLLHGAPLLHTPAKQVSFPLDDEAQDAIELMRRALSARGNASALGIAAPQVGYGLAMFTMRTSPTQLAVFINPVVDRLEDSGRNRDREACLSVPGVNVFVDRFDKVMVRWAGVDGIAVAQEYMGYAARVVQHEYDHLLGITLMDGLTGLVRKRAEQQLKLGVKQAVRRSI